jgi:hypothetical protein
LLVLIEVIFEFFGLVLVVVINAEFEFSFFGAQDDRLAFHPTDHVKGCARRAAQGHLEQVLLNACLDGFAQLALDFEVTISRAKAIDALVRLAMVVILNPQFDAFAGRLEAIELRADHKVLPDRGPEAFDLAQGHGMLRPRFDVQDALLFHLLLKTAGAPPGDILRPVVGEHLLGWLILCGCEPEDFDDRLRRRAAHEIGTDYKARVIVHEADQVGVAAAKAKSEDIGLPKLIGCGAFEEARPAQIAPRFGSLGIH